MQPFFCISPSESEPMTASRVLLMQELQQLIRSTDWPADKQALWLARNGQVDSWDDADEFLLQEAVDYLKKFDKMFQQPLAGSPVRHDTANEREALRVYFGEGEEK